VSGYYKNDIPLWYSGKYKRLTVERNGADHDPAV
jgi:hypothetical protein